jgi:hypothetical protein
VSLDRDGGGEHYKSTLHRTSPGIYEGTEGPEPYPACLDNQFATFTAEHTIEVTAKKKDKAKEIGGTTNVQISGCEQTTFVDYTLVGVLSK